MTLVGAAGFIESRLKQNTEAAAEQSVAIDSAGHYILAPALHAIARSPQPAVCFNAESSVGRRDSRTALCATSKNDETLIHFITVRVNLRVIGKRPANAPDAQIAGRIIIHRRRRVSDATEYKWTTYAAANVPGGDKIFWRDGRA